MDKEEDIKSKIFNIIHLNQNTKKKYFRIEKDKISFSKESKKSIFKTHKDCNFLNRKTKRKVENQKNVKNNKFITVTIDETTASVQSDNSFLIQNIIPKKLKVKENKKKSKRIQNFSKYNENNIFVNKRNNFFHYLCETENLENLSYNIDFEKYKIKLMFVYFNSIKNLCKYINKNLFNIPLNENDNKRPDEFIYQLYQDLQILNRKINDFKFFENIKENLKINKEDFCDIASLKDNLLLMKKILNNTFSHNLLNVYLNIENFCKVYSS